MRMDLYKDLIKLLTRYQLDNHGKRVGRLSVYIGQELGVGLSESSLYQAGLLHDIGKTKVDQNILQRTGPITDKERTEIQAHPILGFERLNRVGVNQLCLDACLFHHERLDMSGYPFGLIGDCIPIVAKIVAIADVYDAMTTNREYRPARSKGEAINVLRGSGFDQTMVNCLIKMPIALNL